MSDPPDPLDRGSTDSEGDETSQATSGDPSGRGDPRDEELLGVDSGTEEPMEGVEVRDYAPPEPNQGRASTPQGELPDPGSRASTPQGELPGSVPVASPPEGVLLQVGTELEMVISVDSSVEDGLLTDEDPLALVEEESPERPNRGRSTETKGRARVRSVVSRVTRSKSPVQPKHKPWCS